MTTTDSLSPLSRIRTDVQSMHAYAVQDSAGLLKLDHFRAIQRSGRRKVLDSLQCHQRETLKWPSAVIRKSPSAVMRWNSPPP